MDKKLEEYISEELKDLERRFEEIEVHEIDNLVGSNKENYKDALMRLKELRNRMERIAEGKK